MFIRINKIDLDQIVSHSISEWRIRRYSIGFRINNVIFSVSSVLYLEKSGVVTAEWQGDRVFDYKFYDALDKTVKGYSSSRPDVLLIHLFDDMIIRIKDIENDFPSVSITTIDDNYVA